MDNKVKQYYKELIVGMALGAALGYIISSKGPISKINECESNLPRNQQCELTAVPVKGE